MLALLLIIGFSLNISVTARPPAPRRQPTRISFDTPEPAVEPGKTVRVKANVFDQRGAEMSTAEVKWDPPKSAAELISLSRPLDGGTNEILITGLTPASPTAMIADVKIHVSSGKATNDLLVHFQSTPTRAVKEISFEPVVKKELLAGSIIRITAKALDKLGNPTKGSDITWTLDSQFDAFATLGAVEPTATSSTVTVFGRSGNGKPEDVPLLVVATSGGVPGIVSLTYKPNANAPASNTISFREANLQIRKDETKSFNVVVKDDKGLAVDGAKITAEIADESHRQFLQLSKPENGEIKVIGLGGDSRVPAPSVILVTVKSGKAVATFPVLYSRGGDIETSWMVLPPNIVGDNFGRTIKNDYYCIEVTVVNKTGSDVSLTGMGFDLNGSVPQSTSYATVHGSLARRKLTHPRTLTLAAIDVAGSLMTGFNPFFHNLNHAKNFSQWIDIVSNPLAKGIDKLWKDSYVDEMARLESDVLRDGKIIPKDGDFKTKIFFPKRALFPNKNPNGSPNLDREDLDKVREALGHLKVMGYKFERGAALP
jgi:hypothetical protein